MLSSSCAPLGCAVHIWPSSRPAGHPSPPWSWRIGSSPPPCSRCLVAGRLSICQDRYVDKIAVPTPPPLRMYVMQRHVQSVEIFGASRKIPAPSNHVQPASQPFRRPRDGRNEKCGILCWNLVTYARNAVSNERVEKVIP